MPPKGMPPKGEHSKKEEKAMKKEMADHDKSKSMGKKKKRMSSDGYMMS